jgi:hypothetical protein
MRRGTGSKPGPVPRSAEERFWEKVDKNGPTPAHCPELGPCWVWTAGKSRYGYGRFNVQGKNELAHHFLHPQVPAGLFVLHRCDNRPCVRPSHHWYGTQKDNMQDMCAKGRAVYYSGEKNSSAKLSDADVERIPGLLAKKLTHQEIADRLNVSRSLISRIVQGKRRNK